MECLNLPHEKTRWLQWTFEMTGGHSRSRVPIALWAQYPMHTVILVAFFANYSTNNRNLKCHFLQFDFLCCDDTTWTYQVYCLSSCMITCDRYAGSSILEDPHSIINITEYFESFLVELLSRNYLSLSLLNTKGFFASQVDLWNVLCML